MKNSLIKILFLFCFASLACSARAYHTAIWEGNAVAIWQKLQPISSVKLAAMKAKENNPTNQQWVQLALLSKKFSNNTLN